MLGEDASGRKVSLLNDSDDTSTSISSIPPRSAPFIRPTLPYRAKETDKVLSRSQRSAGGSNRSTSSRSSISCSPRHSPPTPPLVRLDSRCSVHALKTPSPMTPHYPFDPGDQHDFDKATPQGNLPFYQHHNYPPQAGGEQPNPYSPIYPNQQPYYASMHAQQHLPPVYNHMGHMYPPQPNLHFQPASPMAYSPSHLINPLGPPTAQQGLPSIPPPAPPLQSPHQSNLPPAPTAKSKKDPTSVLPSGSISTVSSAKPNPPPPIKTSNTTTTSNTPSKSGNATKSTAGNATTNPSGTPTSAGPKKKYPCPHAKEYKCTDIFTTSGHAARHGKKHTGEKNVTCPTCNKAFTRKDNMKQHERTHRPGHGSSGSRTAADGSSAANSPTIGAVGSGGPASSKVRKQRTLSASTRASLTSSPSVAGAGAAAPVSRSRVAGFDENDQDEDMDADGEVDVDVDVNMSMNMEMDEPSIPPQQQQHYHHQQQQQQRPDNRFQPQKEQRPPMGKSKLSEILEQVNNNNNNNNNNAYLDHPSDLHMETGANLGQQREVKGEGEEDGEGESPGLDALATVAAGVSDVDAHNAQQQQQQQQMLHRR